MRQRIEVTCPICGKPFSVELEISTYVTAEAAAPPTKKRGVALLVRSHEAKVDFVLRAMQALASKDPSGMIEIEEIVDLAKKVGLTHEEVDGILAGEKEAGHIYEPKPGVVCFTIQPERAKG
jgi:DNA replicative helicase MCM subunit Mcm2 (Cdc46/Mcm family)